MKAKLRMLVGGDWYRGRFKRRALNSRANLQRRSVRGDGIGGCWGKESVVFRFYHVLLNSSSTQILIQMQSSLLETN
jgi:hypothetical protein